MSNQIFSDLPAKNSQILVLFDHDGTTCLTNENAYDSLKFGFREAAQQLGLDPSPLEANWDEFFQSTTGTTELYGAKIAFNKLMGNNSLFEEYARLHYIARANWYRNMKAYQNYIYDTYYPDAENLIFYCWKTPNIHIGLVTGNPEETIKERLSQHLAELFLKPQSTNTFGNEEISREALIKLSIEKAIKNIPNFEPVVVNNFMSNIIYIGDSRADAFAGLNAGVRTIWVPSRSIQAVRSAIVEDSIAFIKKTMPDNLLITNNLETQEVRDFILK